MQYAIFENERVEPTKGKIPACPQCNGEVVAKCGSIKIHHWAHKVKDCDPWSETETEWHKQWKQLVPEACREVTIQNHRADIQLKNGTVIEIQHSHISNIEIAEREQFYGDMFWIFDARKFSKNCILPNSLDISCVKDVDISTLSSIAKQCRLKKEKSESISKIEQLKISRENELINFKSSYETYKWIDLDSLHVIGVITSDWMEKYYNYKTDGDRHIKAINHMKILQDEFSLKLYDLGQMISNNQYLMTLVYKRQWNKEEEELCNNIFIEFSLLFKDTFKNSIKNELDWYKKEYNKSHCKEKIDRLDIDISGIEKEQSSLDIEINKGDMVLESIPYRDLDCKLEQSLVIAGHTLECPSIEFNWKRHSPSILSVNKPMFWDIDGINLLYLDINFLVKSHKNRLQCYLIPKDWIVKYILGKNSSFSYSLCGQEL